MKKSLFDMINFYLAISFGVRALLELISFFTTGDKGYLLFFFSFGFVASINALMHNLKRYLRK